MLYEEYKDIVEASKQEMYRVLGEMRKLGTLSKAHDESHCEAVANYGGIATEALMSMFPNYAENVSNLTRIAGYLHDIKRESTEKIPHGPAGAEYFSNLCKTRSPWTKIDNVAYDAIYRAIQEHEGSFKDIVTKFGSPTQPNLLYNIDSRVPSVVAHGVLVGDKALEASGYRVLERRSYFVGKERMLKDLKDIFKYPDESHLAVLGETQIRLYARNPIVEYPSWLRDFAEEWHAIQYAFYRGLLNYANMTEEEAAKFMLEKKFPKFTPELAEQIHKQRHLDPSYFASQGFIGLANRIEEQKNYDQGDLAISCGKLVSLFAQAESPEKAIEDFWKSKETQPRYLLNFMSGIKEYREGTGKTAENLRKHIITELERVYKANELKRDT